VQNNFVMMDSNSNQKRQKTITSLTEEKLIDVSVNLEKLHKKAIKNNTESLPTNVDKNNGLQFLYW